jgi:glycosyltransferase involved in cell wall biosynthesis
MNIWIFQTGEPLHIDGENARPMRAMNLSNALVETGHKVVLWSSAFYHQEKRHRSSTAQTIQVSDNLEIRLIPSRGYRRHIGIGRLVDHGQLAFNMKKVLCCEQSLPDVGFIGYPPIETAAVMVRWLGKNGVPSLLDVKDQWPSLFLDTLPSLLRPLGHLVFWPYFHLARRAMLDASGIVTMADGFLEWALRFVGRKRAGLDGVFPLTSPSGQVSESSLKSARSWWDSQGIGDDGRPRVCFVGSLSPAFDFKPVQEVAKMEVYGIPACEFVICGDGGSSAELRETMAGLPNVFFPGWIDRPKIEALAERCMAALAPYLNTDSYRRSIPNKVIDALSLSLPIITPLQGEVASLIEEHGVGMRYGTDIGISLYHCILNLKQDAALQKRMAQNARGLYRKKFSFETVYGSLAKHLEKMATNRSADHRSLD